jgi:hypothetical protein
MVEYESGLADESATTTEDETVALIAPASLGSR